VRKTHPWFRTKLADRTDKIVTRCCLRATLECCLFEKSGLADEITSTSTTPERTKEAVKRYSVLSGELKQIRSELARIRGRE
jgi:hypothetical protein